MKTRPSLFAAVAFAAIAAAGSSAAFAQERGTSALGADADPIAISGAPSSQDAPQRASLDVLEGSTFQLAASDDGADRVAVNIASGAALAAAGARGQSASSGQSSNKSSGKSSGISFPLPDIVFDDTWASVGIGAGLVPSYGGSDDYILFPLPLIVGRVGGVGIRPNGPGVRLDLLSPAPSFGASQQKAVFNFGPAIRFRNDRANQIEDEVVELAEDLDVALELGFGGGVTIAGVFNPLDSVTFNTQVRWDILGAHDGMLIEPSIGYSRPFGPGVLFQASIGAQFADDSFANYYYTVTPAQSAATGLPLFNADGGLNNVSSNATVNFDLDGNALNGGLSVYTIVGYTRFVGDAANTPFTAIRGDANQFLGGVGVAYTF